MMRLGERIKVARKAANLSLRALAEEVGVSAQAISKYERGLVTPNSAMLLRLAQALGVKVEFFFRTQQVTLSRPAYRKRTTLPRKQEAAIMGQIQEWIERYLEVEALFPDNEIRQFSIPEGIDRYVSSMEDMEDLASDLRKAWSLGAAPIEDLMALLEDQGIKVGLVDGHSKFDACTFTWNERSPVIVTKRGLPGDRQRFNIAHELGHFIMGTDDEKAANCFAGTFLVPRRMVLFELGAHRRTLDLNELFILKHKYGLSMQAWVYRAKDLGIISESAARKLWQRFSAEGWRQREPGDPFPSEVPKRMEQLVHRALAENLISESRAAELLGTLLRPLFQEDTQPPGKPSASSFLEEETDYAGYPTTLRH